MFLFKNHIQNDEAKRLVPDLFFGKIKALQEIKAKGLQFSFNIFR